MAAVLVRVLQENAHNGTGDREDTRGEWIASSLRLGSPNTGQLQTGDPEKWIVWLSPIWKSQNMRCCHCSHQTAYKVQRALQSLVKEPGVLKSKGSR